MTETASWAAPQSSGPYKQLQMREQPRGMVRHESDLAPRKAEPELHITAAIGRDAEVDGSRRIAFDELMRRAQALTPKLRGLAERTESERRVSLEAIQMLREAQLFKLMQPSRFGGFGYGFAELMDINCVLGQGCGSTAWCASLAMAHQWMVALFAWEAQEEVWRDPDNIVATSITPAGVCELTSGGYRLSGEWPFMSNCDHSEWFILASMLPDIEHGNNKAEWGLLLVPRAEVEIRDTWFVAGLSGTGSNAVAIKEPVFIPRHRGLTMSDICCYRSPGLHAHSDPVYRIPFFTGLPISLVSPALGIVQGAIGDFVEQMTKRTSLAPADKQGPVAQPAHIATRVAEASGALDAAQLLLKRDLTEAESSAASGKLIPVDKRVRNRRDHAYAIKLAVAAVNLLFDAVGGKGLHLSSPIQRAWRDVHAIAHHHAINWEAVSAMYGQYQFGVEPNEKI